MTYWIAIQERETGNWSLAGPMPYDRNLGTEKRPRRVQRDYLCDFEFPENKSPFIKAHKIFEAQTQEEACQLVSTFPREK
jgi:hypothetical protein